MFAIQVLLALAGLGFAIFNGFKSVIHTPNRSGGTSPSGINIVRVGMGFIPLLLILMVVNPSFGQVPAGYRGVVLQFGAVTGEMKQEGLYFVTPFVNSVALMNVQVHADKSVATAVSRDLQQVQTEVTVNYRLVPEKSAAVYRDLRNDYFERIGVPAIQEAVKASTAHWDAERLVVDRPQVKDEIEKYLQHRLGQHGMLVDGIALTDFRFSKEFETAIEQKVTATQNAMTAENTLRQVKAEAEQTIAKAKAQAETIRIQAQAINAQGGDDYVRLKAIEKWDGSVPQYMGVGNTVPFVDLNGKR